MPISLFSRFKNKDEERKIKELTLKEAMEQRKGRVTSAVNEAVKGDYISFKSLITLAHSQVEWENDRAMKDLDIFSYVSDLFVDVKDNNDMKKLFTMIDNAPNERLREIYGVCAELTLFPYSKIWAFPDMTNSALEILREAKIPYYVHKLTDEKSFTYILPSPKILTMADKYIEPLFADNEAYYDALNGAYNPEAMGRVKRYCEVKKIKSRYIY